MRVVFAGTAEFSVYVLRALMESRHSVIAAISQPDKPKGRHLTIAPTPVKEIALASGIEVLQPEKLDEPNFRDQLETLVPEAIVVAAYGRLIPKWMLDLPPFGCLNVHASLLPKYRGAAPIRRALMNGESETGVTIMLVEEELDAGPVFKTVHVTIDQNDDAQTLGIKLAKAGAAAMLEVLDGLERRHLKPVQQDHSQASYADKIDKSEYWLDWNSPVVELANKIRALAPAPGARTRLNGNVLKILTARIGSKLTGLPPGSIECSGTSLNVAAHGASLEIIELQPENRSRMSAAAWVRGIRLDKGAKFS